MIPVTRYLCRENSTKAKRMQSNNDTPITRVNLEVNKNRSKLLYNKIIGYLIKA